MTKQTPKLLLFGGIACVLCVAAMAVCLFLYREKTAFTPPPFEENAVDTLPENLPDSFLLTDKDASFYQAGICGSFPVTEKGARVCLYNPAENTVWIKLRIYSPEGETLGESGLLKPGMFLEYLPLSEAPETEEISVKIMGYEPETYKSAGAIQLVLRNESFSD